MNQPHTRQDADCISFGRATSYVYKVEGIDLDLLLGLSPEQSMFPS